ncbi:bifunctional hydroxymethylpyrimidine kinase/phosphomethylpyrimidine kinase [Halorubellus sp. JP-L1]|uniref:bifunctional hydroxymethylpyrimidine kinase/phosphomethylpyrimidine kinase n=1 Tax=Halorubellus sp. JP-L1 TaxID=2715753 RepID=UPI00140906A5|nr:bifunctional hydroxymethylpyrimidine kinase/phosphomethylpyrimidine kinase [Halorubellus sp. JP-L1]NHN41927.1 bifunctional hydroxymethylpyrimidine kinase/phosphomethylpyrimidine kinase [Halorubellus sp. JP-L1]
MRKAAPVSRPVALTVAGSDAGGGAGVQADLQTFAGHDVHGTSVVTAVTAQHTRGVESTHVLPPGEVAAQIDAVADDFAVGAVKTGMLATVDVVETVHDHVRQVDAPLVVDPVMVATSGDRLLDRDAERAYDDLLADATVATPNADEAAVLADVDVESVSDARDAALAIRDRGVDHVLVTGGHLEDDDAVTDVLATEDSVRTFTHDRIRDAATHGSGCTLSAAIAATLAREAGNDDRRNDATGRSVASDVVVDAVADATTVLERAVRYHHDVGQGPGAVQHLVDARTDAALPAVARDVERVVAHVETATAPVDALIPEVGTNVVGAPAHAETVAETVAVDGRLATTYAGVRATGGVRPGASSHVARFLLAAREHHPELRYAANCRYDDAVADALDALEWPVAAYDRADEPDDAPGTMDWGTDRAYRHADLRPVAVVDRGAHGKEPMTKLATETADELANRLDALATELANGDQ